MKKLSVILLTLLLTLSLFSCNGPSTPGGIPSDKSPEELIAEGKYLDAYKVLLTKDDEASKAELAKFFFLPAKTSQTRYERTTTVVFTWAEDGRPMKTVRSQGENSVELVYEYGLSYWAYSNNKNFFNVKGLVVRNEYTRSDNEVNVTVFEYDEKGNLVRSTETIPGNDSPTVYTYTYDDKGNLTYRDRGGDQTTFTYDESGKRIKANMTVNDGNSYETVYTYNDKGELIKMTETKTKNGASETHSETVFTYDDKGRVTSSTMTMPDGYTSKDAWTYDEYGNVIKIEETWGNPGSLTTSVIENTDYQIFYTERLHPVLNEVLASFQPEIDLG